MSTILDALRKLQRERAAQTPAKDLRGSITHESTRSRRRGSGARNLGLALALIAIAGGGYALYRSGQLHGLLARFSSEDDSVSDAEFAEVEREVLEREAAAQAAAARVEMPPAAETPAAPPSVARLPRGPRNAPPRPNVAGAPGESPEILAERARLEAALANARAAQEAQQRGAREAEAAQQAAANPPAPAAATDAAPTSASPAAPAPATQKRVVAKRPVMPGEPVAAPVPQPQAKPLALPAPKPEAEEIEARAVPRAADDPAPARTAFPEVWVESIRWHPVAERRVASLRFERQNAPEAREGDIVAGVLVYRIDPGSVELRVGSAQRTVSPGP